MSALAPLGVLFGGAAAARAWSYRSGLRRAARLRGCVISVGNLAVGGRGKTPVVALFARWLQEAGLPVAILSRGYRGSFRGEVLVVSDGERVLAGAREAGDEPVMLARALPGVVVAVGRRRDVVGRAVEDRFGPRVHLLDDGFQHLRLARDLDVVVVSDGDLRGRPLPAGELRERPSALGRADVVLLAGEGALCDPSWFRLRRRPAGFRTLTGAPAAAPARAFLAAGIAAPERFRADVSALGVTVAGERLAGDHHAFETGEWEDVRVRANAARAEAVVITAKDAARLDGRLPSLGLPLLVLASEVEIEGGDALRERVVALAAAPTRPRRDPRRELRFRLEDGAAGLVEAAVAHLPRPWVLRLGRALGSLWARLDPRHVAIAVDSLGRAFPDWDEARRQRTARGVYRHFGQVILDLLWMGRRSREEVLALVDFEGTAFAEAAAADGRGILFPSAHLGNWELHAVAHSFVRGPVAVVARPLDNPGLDARLCAFRTLGGNEVIYKRNALAHVLRALKAGTGVAVLIDQNVQEKDGIFVDFFGRPAATTTVAAALAVKTGGPVLPCHTELREDGRYRLVYDPPVVWTPSGNREEDIRRLTQELTARIEAWVRARPEQWLWIHRRWKTRPPGESGPA